MQETIAPVAGIHGASTRVEAVSGAAGGTREVSLGEAFVETAPADRTPALRRALRPLLLSPGPVSRHSSFFLEVLGEGFLPLETPRGRRYLREGLFRCDAEGRIVRSDGLCLGSRAALGSRAEALVITPEGCVFEVSGAGGFRAAGGIELVGFARPGGLRWETGLGLAETPESGPPAPGARGWIRCEPRWPRGWPTPEIAAAWIRERTERHALVWAEKRAGTSFDGRA
ncbi:MAG TPA: hypothetical protein VNO22_00100 [Planctomycetota bacterium]|nr:hypothetical protein [Planctomycetota bacterium]